MIVLATIGLLFVGAVSSDQFTPSLGDTAPGSVWPQPQIFDSSSVVSQGCVL